MRRFAVAAIVVALAGVAHFAAALPMGPVCCACLPSGTGQTSGNNHTTVTAFFCAQAPPADPAQLEVQCNGAPGRSLDCFPGEPGLSCIAEFADAGIVCPRSGAPAAGPATLLALAVSLAAVGALMARRRRRN